MRRISLRLSGLDSSPEQVTPYFVLEHKSYQMARDADGGCSQSLHLHPRYWHVSARVLSTAAPIPLIPLVLPPGAISLTLRALGEVGDDEDGFRSTAFHELSVPGVVVGPTLLLIRFAIPDWDRFIARIKVDKGLFPYPARSIELTTRVPV